MANTETATTVQAKDVADALGIPAYVVYRLAERGVLPATDLSSEWATRRRWVFNLDEAVAAYRGYLEQRERKSKLRLRTV